MTLAALVLVAWIALGIAVIGILNVAKWAVRAAARHGHIDVPAASSWPAPRLSSFEPTPAVGLFRAHNQAARVDHGPTAPR